MIENGRKNEGKRNNMPIKKNERERKTPRQQLTMMEMMLMVLPTLSSTHTHLGFGLFFFYINEEIYIKMVVFFVKICSIQMWLVVVWCFFVGFLYPVCFCSLPIFKSFFISSLDSPRDPISMVSMANIKSNFNHNFRGV